MRAQEAPCCAVLYLVDHIDHIVEKHTVMGYDNHCLRVLSLIHIWIVIGEEASVTDGAAEAKVRFKSRYLTDPSASADVRAFAQGVMNELRCV